MENLRWILIFAGVAILVLLYLSGRQPKAGSRRQADALNRSNKRSHGQDSRETIDPLMGDDSFADPGGFGDSGGFGEPDEFSMDDDLDNPFERPGGRPAGYSADEGRAQRSNSQIQNSGTQSSAVSGAMGGLGGISSKIEAFGSKLSPKRRARAAESDKARPADADAYASKIVTLHVVAPEGQLMNGAHLLEQFEQRGYHYGDMNIFHSMHEGKTVFSVAKLVVPGTFDINDVDSFQTPGISLILQLPGPVPADVAFEVLLSEAHEIADTLGATVLDADRSTLSKQTVQHMREGISEYMHRQKYFSGVPS